MADRGPNPNTGIGGNNPPADPDEERLGHPYGGQGWVAVARAMRFHPVVGCGRPVPPADPDRGSWSRYEAFQDLIMECRYEAGRVNNGGRMMEIKPGQLLGAVSWLAHRWNWTPKTVRNFLDRLEEEGMITSAYGEKPIRGETDSKPGNQEGKHKGKQAKIISVCKYDIYQLWRRHRGQTEGQIEGLTKGKQGANEGQHLNKGTIKQDSLPPSPLAGGEPALPLVDHVQAQRDAEEIARRAEARSARAAETKRLHAEHKAMLEQAVEIFNKAADHFRFSRCDVLSEARATRLLKRLDEIGGIEPFRKALRAIGKDDFLAGRRPARAGEQPFRLDIDRLLQTNGGLGDVLARLIELGNVTDVPRAPNGKDWGWWRASEDKLRALKPDFWRRRLDEVKPNGTWPWWSAAWSRSTRARSSMTDGRDA